MGTNHTPGTDFITRHTFQFCKPFPLQETEAQKSKVTFGHGHPQVGGIRVEISLRFL